jgi:hypothetical protein
MRRGCDTIKGQCDAGERRAADGLKEMAIDIAALERESGRGSRSGLGDEGSLMVASWAPPDPQILLDIEIPEPSEYVVNVYTQDEFRLVAAVELVTPSNKDRPENRKTFVNKSEALLKKDVCVTIVDVVTSRTATLYGELLDELAAERTTISRSAIYAATCRGRRSGARWRLESWEHELIIGVALPTLPRRYRNPDQYPTRSRSLMRMGPTSAQLRLSR